MANKEVGAFLNYSLNADVAIEFYLFCGKIGRKDDPSVVKNGFDPFLLSLLRILRNENEWALERIRNKKDTTD